MSEEPNQNRKIEVEPRELPQEREPAGQPFEQLNDATAPATSVEAARKNVVRPRDLPSRESPFASLDQRDAGAMKEAIRRIVEGGESVEDVARQLKIEPLKLRHWEIAYHEMLQRNLNDGEFHDTDAQLRELTRESRERFQDNWEQMLEKFTERRLKIDSFKERLIHNPLTRWMFRNRHGDWDYATISGVVIAVTLVIGGTLYAASLPGRKVADEETTTYVPKEFQTVQHDNRKAALTVRDFLISETWEEKLKFILNPEQMKPLMKAWYEKYPDQVHYDRVGFLVDEPITMDGRHFLLLAVIGSKHDDPTRDKPFYMLLEKLGADYKVDWEVSSGYQSMPLDEFVIQRPTEPVELRLMLKQGEYFNFHYNSDDFLCFEIANMDLTEKLYLYAPRSDKKATQIFNTLGVTGRSAGAIVKVRFPKDRKDGNQLDLVEVVSSNWIRKAPTT